MRKETTGMALAMLLASAISANAGLISGTLTSGGTGPTDVDLIFSGHYIPGPVANSYKLTDISGIQKVGGIAAPAIGLTLGIHGADDIFYGPLTDLTLGFNGFAFNTAGGFFNVNYDAAQSAYFEWAQELLATLAGGIQPVTFNAHSIPDVDQPTPIPEPVTLTIFGAGLGGAIIIRRRKKTA